jgi:hypothetical protein
MIKAIRETTIKPADSNNPQAGTHTASESMLIIAITDKSEHYHLFDALVDSIKVDVEEKVIHTPGHHSHITIHP